jgi:23S rRNA maturation-related 3'-5' exoribonuclease YhaM
MNKTQVFQEELSQIRNPKIRGFTEKAIESLPDYFFEVPASSTGKYHPNYALGEGGLVRHTKAAVRIAIELFRVDMFKYNDDEKDMIISALILHDGAKSGIQKQMYTITEHPLEITRYIRTNNDLNNILEENIFNTILGCIETHMGKWNRDYKTNKEVLPLPQTKMQKFVHICDYLASRKCLEFNFDVDVIRE